MNNKMTNFVKNFSYSLSSNIINMLVSVLVVLIVPRILGVEQYGYYQLYIFYSSYIGLFHFGWTDGIYLRYGGKDYNELDKKLFVSQFWMLLFLEVVVGLIITLLALVFIKDVSKLLVLISVCVAGIITLPKGHLLLTLLSTNRIKDYAKIIILEKIFFLLLVILFISFGISKFEMLLLADIVAKLLAFIGVVWICRDIVVGKSARLKEGLYEAWKNINVGFKLTAANVAGILIIGIVRMGIEFKWNIATFGKVSLTLSISSLLMVFVEAVGIVMFPMLRRTERKKLPYIYILFRNILTVVLLAMLTIYYPARIILSLWLPKYADSLKYMAFIVPHMCLRK